MTPPAPSHLALVDDAARDLDRWPARARTGYVVRGADGARRTVVVGVDGTLAVEGVGTFEILEEVRVAERRAGFAALRAGRL
jgi:hypothetical protein